MNARSLLVFLALSLGALTVAHSQDVKVTFECEMTGTKLDGSVSAKPFKERFFHESKEMKDNTLQKGGPWRISKTEFHSDGKEIKEAHASRGEGYLVFTTVAKSGSGFNQKLLVFTHYIDLQSAEIERVVTRIPKDAEERTKGRCKKVG